MRILFDRTLPYIARVLGGFMAMSFAAPDEVAAYFSWTYKFDLVVSLWFLYEFAAITRVTKPRRSYALSSDGIINILAVIPPTGIVPIEAIRHCARFLMATTATPMRYAIHKAYTAVKRVAVESKRSITNMFLLLLSCVFIGTMFVSILEPDVTSPAAWVLTTILPFVNLPAELSSTEPSTTIGQLLELPLTLVGYVLLVWFGAIALKTWKFAIGDSSSESKE